jgi:hypothetical protein
MQNTLKNLLLQAIMTEGGIEKLYKEATSEFRPIIDALPKVAPIAAKDVATAVVTIQKIANEVAENEDVKAEAKRWKTQQIKKRKEILDEYFQAGFTRDEAFEMLRLDVMNAKATLANNASNVKISK